MKVLVVADGSRGDVQPMTVLAAQLQREGRPAIKHEFRDRSQLVP